jgi:hypothetical protein
MNEARPSGDGPGASDPLAGALAQAGRAYAADPPSRRRLLQLACPAQDFAPKENGMIVNRLFAGRSWPVRIAFGAGLAALLVGLALAPHARALAASEGFVLTYKLDSGRSGDASLAQIRSAVAGVEQAGLPEGSAVNIRTVPQVDDQGQATGTDALVEATGDSQLEDTLASAVGQIPGMPEAQRAVGVWFGEGVQPRPQAQGTHLTFTFKDSTTIFTFPLGTSAADMEQAVGGWMKDRDPGNTYNVSVTLGPDGTLSHLSVSFAPVAGN